MIGVTRVVGLVMLLGLGTAAHANPIVYVQPIDVCASDGTNCAIETGVAGAYSPATIQKAFAQAGVTINLLAPVQYNNSAFLNPAVIDDPANGYTTGNPTDPAHLLFNTPGHMQNANKQVINLYFVDTIPHSTVQGGVTTPAPLLFGLALQDANGAVATTHAQSAGGTTYIPSVDNAAHEIGHTLGLTHVEDPPLAGTAANTPENLMRSVGRDVATDPCQVTPTTCGGVSKDVLTAGQIATVQASAEDLFSVDLATASASFSQSGNVCQAGSFECVFTVDFPASNTSETLVGVKVRYLQATATQVNAAIGGFLKTGSSTCDLSGPLRSVNAPLAGGGFEQDLTFPIGCFTSGSELVFADIPSAIASDTLPDLTPFSFEYDFSDGKTSRAAFNASGGMFTAVSTDPIELGNVALPQQPGIPLPRDPDQFNALSVPEDGGALAVPEPPGVAVVLVGLLACLSRRRRNVTP